MEGVYNPAYISNETAEVVDSDNQNNNINKNGKGSRDNWGNGIEFLLSCVAIGYPSVLRTITREQQVFQ